MIDWSGSVIEVSSLSHAPESAVGTAAVIEAAKANAMANAEINRLFITIIIK